MKKSISIWSFYGDWTLKEKMKLAKDAGFEGIELDKSYFDLAKKRIEAPTIGDWFE